MSTTADISMYPGTSRLIKISLVNETNGAVDLTGCQLKWSAGRYGHTFMTKTHLAGITITDAVAGKCEFKISAAESKDLLGDYEHRFLLTDSLGDGHLAVRGALHFL